MVDGMCFAAGQKLGSCSACNPSYSTDRLHRLTGETRARHAQLSTLINYKFSATEYILSPFAYFFTSGVGTNLKVGTRNFLSCPSTFWLCNYNLSSW